MSSLRSVMMLLREVVLLLIDLTLSSIQLITVNWVGLIMDKTLDLGGFDFFAGALWQTDRVVEYIRFME